MFLSSQEQYHLYFAASQIMHDKTLLEKRYWDLLTTAKIAYDACMDVESIEKSGYEAFKEEIEEIYDQLDSKYVISYKGDITNYLGVHITQTRDQVIQLTQKKLINSIIRDMNLLETTK